MPEEPNLPKIEIAGVTVYDARQWFPDQAPAGGVVFHSRSLDQITGIAAHHDAVAFQDVDRNFNGTTIDEERARMQASYNWHTKFFPQPTPIQGWDGRYGWNWPGMGYHIYVFPSGRIYLIGTLQTVRAHVAYRNTPLAGIVFAGDFTTLRPAIGSILAGGAAILWLWALIERIIPTEGHRWHAVEGWETSCPGDTYAEWVPRLEQTAAKLAAALANEDAEIKIRAALTPAFLSGNWAFLCRQLRYIGAC